jgi:hypothetical protein
MASTVHQSLGDGAPEAGAAGATEAQAWIDNWQAEQAGDRVVGAADAQSRNG